MDKEHDLASRLADVIGKMEVQDGCSVVLIGRDGEIAVAVPLLEDTEDSDLPVGIRLAISISAVYSEEEFRDQLIQAVYKDGPDSDDLPPAGTTLH